MGSCSRCELAKAGGHSNCIGGIGDDGAVKVLILGEFPSEVEDLQGKPFMDSEGAILFDLLLEDHRGVPIWLSHAARCRPFPGALPSKSHVKQCRVYLEEEVGAKEPIVILALGQVAYGAIFGRIPKTMSNLAGYPLRATIGNREVFVVPTWSHRYVAQNGGVEGYHYYDWRRHIAMAFDIARCGGVEPKTSVEVIEHRSVRAVADLYNRIVERGRTAWDIETNTLRGFSAGARVVSHGFAFDDHQAHVVLVDHFEGWWTDAERDQVRAMTRGLLTHPGVELSGHNAFFDFVFMRGAEGYFPRRLRFDTMGAAHMLRPGEPKDLKWLAQRELNWLAYDRPVDQALDALRRQEVQEARRRGETAPDWVKDYSTIPWSILGRYNGMDAHMTHHLEAMFERLLLQTPKLHELFHHTMLDANALCMQIYASGWKIDTTQYDTILKAVEDREHLFLEKLRQFPQIYRVSHRVAEREWQKRVRNSYQNWRDRKIRKDRGEEIRVADEWKNRIAPIEPQPLNWNSPKQVAELLFDELQLPDPSLKTRNGRIIQSRKTAREFLEELDHPIPRLLMGYRKESKIAGTYLRPMPGWLDENDILHPYLNVFGTSTLRQSSSDPNLQNIPNGHVLQRMFVSRFEGGFITGGDHSQAELRGLGGVSNEPEFFKVYRSGGDLHTRTAALVAKVADEEVTPKMRSRAKAINFGIIYGIGASRLAAQTGMSFDEAVQFMIDWNKSFPGAKRWIDTQVEFARANGYVETEHGFRRPLPFINSTNDELRVADEHKAANTPIQSDATLINARGAVALHRAMRRDGLRSYQVNLVHDAVYIDTHPDEVGWFKENLCPIMESVEAPWLNGMPLKFEAKLGRSWFDVQNETHGEVLEKW